MARNYSSTSPPPADAHACHVSPRLLLRPHLDPSGPMHRIESHVTLRRFPVDKWRSNFLQWRSHVLSTSNPVSVHNASREDTCVLFAISVRGFRLCGAQIRSDGLVGRSVRRTPNHHVSFQSPDQCSDLVECDQSSRRLLEFLTTQCIVTRGRRTLPLLVYSCTRRHFYGYTRRRTR